MEYTARCPRCGRDATWDQPMWGVGEYRIDCPTCDGKERTNGAA